MPAGRSGRSTGTARRVGLVLDNPSADRDALDVNVLVDFADATNTVLVTDTARIDGIAAGSRFHVGGGANVPTPRTRASATRPRARARGRGGR
jgi:hypothetical protein